MRLNHEQLNGLKEKYGVDRIWSFSRINTAHNCLHEYKAKYIDHLKLDGSNVYTEWGTHSHDLIQALITGDIEQNELKDKWQGFINDWEADPNAYQFDTQRIQNGYLHNLQHYFEHAQVPKGIHFEVEKPVLVRIGDKKQYVFVGYVDTQYVDENGNLVLIDYKTSSKSSFSKAKFPEKSKQLMLYAIGKHQYSHIPYEKIKCRFDMMKYVDVHYKQENGKWKDTIQERTKWVSKIEKKLITKLKKLGLDEDKIAEMVQIAILANNLDNLPQEVQDQFQLSNYYIDLDITEENCQKVADEVAKDCGDLVEFERMAPEQQESYLEVNEPYDPNNYYDKKLCAYHTSDYFKDKEEMLTPDSHSDDEDTFGLFSEDEIAQELFV